MALVAGTKLGPYEVQSLLGAGGMGEVYRARDPRLDRSVALKILPEHLAEQLEAAERFEREARTISSLSHPNVCQLHDVGEQGGVRYLVMELLEGETLADRLRRGPLPLDQVLRYGAEVAAGLDAAHRRGVVHRDLKPGNIMLTKTGAKLMDFGLAKGAAKPVSTQLTVTMACPNPTPLTQKGTIVGTFQYMAPEQVEGKEADARSDIFSLGAVLYEMVSSKRAFDGKTLVSVAAAILEKEPEPIRNLQPVTPIALERLIKKCLQKDPGARWQCAGDLGSELKWIAESGPVSEQAAQIPSKPQRLPWLVAAVALLAAFALGVLHFGASGTSAVIRTQIAASDKLEFNFVGDESGPPVISPDGRYIVFSAKEQGRPQLYLRAMDKVRPQPILGTDGATYPFWSPDSRSIAFFADGKLRRVAISGGPPVVVCDAPIARGGSWSANDTILFTPETTQPLFQVRATGGNAVAVTKLSGRYTTHRWPAFLPDGKHFLYFAAIHSTGTDAETAVFWASLDGKESRLLIHSLSNAIYASGHLLYVRDNTLVAQLFDPSTGTLKGEPAVLNDDVQVDATIWRGTFSASDNGTLLYQPAMADAGYRLTWFDRTGKPAGELLGPGSYYQIQLSPDDKKLAIVENSSNAGTIWIVDVARGTRARLTYNGSYAEPVWSRDGKQIAYVAASSALVSATAILTKSADGSGEERKLLDLDPAEGASQGLDDWSPDGRFLLFHKGTRSAGSEGIDLWVLPLSGDRKPFLYCGGPGNQTYAQFSPDGKWVAYSSDESGRFEIYVAPFPWTGAKWQVSTKGGTEPRWGGDGKEIFFTPFGFNTTMSAEVSSQGATFEVGEVRPLFEVLNLSPSIAGSQYVITRDAKRILWITTGESSKLPLTVIQNWTAELKK